ncbi:MAG: sugar ABC transporter permease [Clostridia bacterium]|nr:sugar ABC transporter permease [Clostridia bacterium]
MEKQKYASKKGRERLSLAVIYTILILISLVWLIPFFLIVILSLRGEAAGMSAGYIFPKEWSFKNYITLFTETQFLRWYGNTLLVSLVVTIFQTIIVLMTSYALSRLRFKMRKPLMNLMLILGMFPGFLSMTAVYFILDSMHFTNVIGLILVYSASSAMQYYICKGFFDTIPKSLDEAARIDGASRHTVFFKIILPLAKPIIIYTILTAFIAPWGEYMFSSLIVGTGSMDNYTVAVGMWKWLENPQLRTAYFPVFCAAAVIVSIPITALFIWLQRYYVEGVTGGSVKG